jgi:hypothetical protein
MYTAKRSAHTSEILDNCQTHMIEFYYLLKKETTMGDRANFGIRQADGNTIFVYGHWAGHQMLAKFAKAINRVVDAGRMGDNAYATRIIISDLIGEDWSQDMRWGITVNTLADNEHKVPVYDLTSDTVTLYDVEDWRNLSLGAKIVEFSREDFVRKYSKEMVGV